MTCRHHTIVSPQWHKPYIVAPQPLDIQLHSWPSHCITTYTQHKLHSSFMLALCDTTRLVSLRVGNCVMYMYVTALLFTSHPAFLLCQPYSTFEYLLVDLYMYMYSLSMNYLAMLMCIDMYFWYTCMCTYKWCAWCTYIVYIYAYIGWWYICGWCEGWLFIALLQSFNWNCWASKVYICLAYTIHTCIVWLMPCACIPAHTFHISCEGWHIHICTNTCTCMALVLSASNLPCI